MPSAWDETPVAPGAPKVPAVSAWDAAPIAQAPALVGNPENGGFWSGVKFGLRDPFHAGGQLMANTLPPSVVGAMDDANKRLYDLTGGSVGSETPFAQTSDRINQQSAQYDADRQAAGRKGIDWGRALGAGIPTTAAAIATGGATAPATIPAAVGQGALWGGAGGALTPVQEGDFWSKKAGQVASGAAAGGTIGGGFKVLGNLVSPVIDAAQQKLVDAGLKLTPGQILGGGWKRIEDAATSIPIVGDFIKNAQRGSFESLSTAAINKSLEPIGVKLPQGVTGREAIQFADDAISKFYDTTLKRIGALQFDQQLPQDISKLSALVPQNKQIQEQVVNTIKAEVLNRFDKKGVMTAEGFKAAESNLGNLARQYSTSNDADQRMMGAALGEARNILRQWLQRAAPPGEAANVQAANTAFAAFLRPQRAASMVGAESGVFTPEQLQNAVRALDSSKRDKAFARGEALMQDLSEPAKNVMGNKVPDSGTPFRSAVQNPIAAATMGTVGALPAAAVYTGPTSALIRTLIAGPRSQNANAQLVADALRRLGPVLGAAAPAITQTNK